MIYKISCQYCSYNWEAYVYTPAQLKSKFCTKCGDKNLDFRKLEDTKIDTYVGCPPFPNKKEDIPKDDFYGD